MKDFYLGFCVDLCGLVPWTWTGSVSVLGWGRLLPHGHLHRGKSLLPEVVVSLLHVRELLVGLHQPVLCHHLLLVLPECKVDVPLRGPTPRTRVVLVLVPS